LAQAVHELAVGNTQFLGACIDAGDPQTAEIALARTPVAIGILTRLEHRLPGDPVAAAAGAVVALGLLQNLLVACLGCHAALDSCHPCASCCCINSIKNLNPGDV